MELLYDEHFINTLFKVTSTNNFHLQAGASSNANFGSVAPQFPNDLYSWYISTLAWTNSVGQEAAGSQPDIDSAESFSLADDALDQDSNFDFRNLSDDGTEYSRGGYPYIRPYGWFRLGLNIKNRFGDSSWIGGVHDTMANRKDSVAGEWAVSYHGTNRDAAASIVNSGAYDQGKSKRQKFGKGIYSTPFPAIAEKNYAKFFDYDGKRYKVMIQNRVDMSHTEIVNKEKYYVTEDDQFIRPYGLLFKSC
ncbi:uncharacterized protein LOC142355269 [Convolutriloba macropyga]|uniref:uncharacterized protein LOC142355269 n=1 Tax=Convolutriloba macropyga TaxID=536237 RepID=UPI003F51AEE6